MPARHTAVKDLQLSAEKPASVKAAKHDQNLAMVINTKISLTANIIITVGCATILAILAAIQSAFTTSILTLVLLLIILLAQYSLAQHLLIQTRRTQRYHQLGRKLAHDNRTKKRDEKVALKVLNHIVDQSDKAPLNTHKWQQPLANFSGDLAITCQNDEGTSYTLLADLTGHGIAAAMGATPVASIFKATARRGLSVEQIMIELNNKLTRLLPSGFFCCTAVAMCEGRRLTVCNAGLPDILVANRDGQIADRIKSSQLPLGIEMLDESKVSVFTKTYPTPHQLYAFTDGLIETRSANDNVFDSKVLESLIARETGTISRIPSIQQHFQDFVKGSVQLDDISIVEVKIC